MPRGGKRPGAGAPRGNFNGVRSGNHSSRMLMVYLAIINHQGKKALAQDLYEQGFFPPHRMRFNNDGRGVVTYLYGKWFDCLRPAQSNAIKPNQTITPRPARADSDPATDTAPEVGK